MKSYDEFLRAYGTEELDGPARPSPYYAFIRESFDFTANDFKAILYEMFGEEGIAVNFNPLEHEAFADLLDHIIDNILWVHDDPEADYMKALRTGFVQSVYELIQSFDGYLQFEQDVQNTVGMKTRALITEDEKLSRLIDTAAQKIAYIVGVVQEYSDEQDFRPDQLFFRSPEFLDSKAVTHTERKFHENLCELFHTYLSVPDDKVHDFLYNENFPEKLLQSAMLAPEVTRALKQHITLQKMEVEATGRTCILNIRDQFKEVHKNSLRNDSIGNGESLQNVSEMGTSIRRKMLSAADAMAQATQAVKDASLKNTERPEFKGLS